MDQVPNVGSIIPQIKAGERYRRAAREHLRLEAIEPIARSDRSAGRLLRPVHRRKSQSRPRERGMTGPAIASSNSPTCSAMVSSVSRWTWRRAVEVVSVGVVMASPTGSIACVSCPALSFARGNTKAGHAMTRRSAHFSAGCRHWPWRGGGGQARGIILSDDPVAVRRRSPRTVRARDSRPTCRRRRGVRRLARSGALPPRRSGRS